MRIIAYASIVGLSALGAVAAGSCGTVYAQSDRFHITAAEKAACMGDAARLCLSSYPDEGRLLACMVANKAALTPSCLVVFNAGLRRRRLGVR